MNVLVIGTSVIDVFLKADSHHFSSSKNSVSFTLGDKIPVETQKLSVGGNAANVAISLSRLEIPTLLYTYLGDDILAQKIRDTVTQEGIELLAQVSHNQTTPLHLIFNFESDRIIFSGYPVKDYAFSYNTSIHPDFIYVTSIGDHWEGAYQDVLNFIEKYNIPFAFSPGSRQLTATNDLFFKVLARATYVFMNKEEAEIILKKKGKHDTSIDKILRNVKNLGPKIVSITDGKNGAYVLDEIETMYKIAPHKDEKPLVQKTGAGDSYSAAFLAAHLLGNSVPESMRWGSLNAHGVMEHLGAQEGLLTQQSMKQLLSQYSDFQAVKM